MFLSLLAVCVLRAALATAQITTQPTTTAAPVFVPLDQQVAFSTLDDCGKKCLTDPGKYYDEAAAVSNCPTFTNDLSTLHTCETAHCTDSASGYQAQSDYLAQSVLAAFCTSVALNNSIMIPAAVPALATTNGVTSVVVATTQAISTTLSSSITGVSTPSATGSNASHDPVPSTATSRPPVPATVTTSQATGNATSTPESKQVSGLTSSQKVGIGAGVGLGIPIFFGILAALFYFTRRRKTKGAGPYGPVMTSDKGVSESGSYGGHGVEPHEMQHLGSNAPFLPAIATRDMVAKQPEYEETPQTARSYEQQAPPPQPDPYTAAGRPATSRDVSRSSTPPLDIQTRPATVPQHLEPVEDEPPSPVSPVSPISAAGSRPASLRHSREHDLR